MAFGIQMIDQILSSEIFLTTCMFFRKKGNISGVYFFPELIIFRKIKNQVFLILIEMFLRRKKKLTKNVKLLKTGT